MEGESGHLFASFLVFMLSSGNQLQDLVRSEPTDMRTILIFGESGQETKTCECCTMISQGNLAGLSWVKEKLKLLLSGKYAWKYLHDIFSFCH